MSPAPLWVGLIVGVLMQLAAGTPYMAALFGQPLKARYGFTQLGVMLIQTLTQVGLYCGLTQGLLYDKWGPRVASTVATVLVCVGYLAAYMAVRLDRVPAVVFGLCFFVVGQGSHGLYTASAMTNVVNFPAKHRGKVMGLLAASMALGAALFATIARALGVEDPESYGDKNTSALCGIESHGNAGTPDDDADAGDAAEAGRALARFFVTAAAILFCVGICGVALLRRSPSLVDCQAVAAQNARLSGADSDVSLPVHDETGIVINKPRESGETGDPFDLDDGDRAPLVAQWTASIAPLDVWGRGLLADSNFWLLFATMAIEDGAALMFVNSVGSMNRALEAASLPPRYNSGTLILAFSTSNMVGRCLWGLCSDGYQQNRPFVLFCTTFLMMLSHAQMAIFPTYLLLAAVMIGVSFGGMFSIAPVIVKFVGGELFGNKHFGTNWGFLVLAPAVGSLTFGGVYGRLYDLATSTHVLDGCPARQCAGSHCFRKAYVITTVALFCGCLFILGLAHRTRAQCAPRAGATPLRMSFREIAESIPLDNDSDESE